MQFLPSNLRATRLLGPALLALALPALGCQRASGVPTVMLITVDSVNRRVLLGNGWGWETAPRLTALFEESGVFYNTLSPRGLTQVALTSLHTGAYPRDHTVHTNKDGLLPTVPTLFQGFHEAHYRTIGYTANKCQMVVEGVDDSYCTAAEALPDLGTMQERDDVLVSALLDTLDRLPSDEHVFTWLHLNYPHKPYVLHEDWYNQFHPESYDGDLDPSKDMHLSLITLGEAEYTEADRYHLEAAYASQIRETDVQIARVLDKLQELDRYNDAVIVFGIDHGEELAEHNDFFWHGCSPYSSVLAVLYAIKAPDITPRIFEEWVSSIDMAPTLVELSGAYTRETVDAERSLVETLMTGEQQPVPVFFERGTETAGVVQGSHKYILSGVERYDACPPYIATDHAFVGELEELYDLEADPTEANNLMGVDETERDTLRATLCEWIQRSPWVGASELADNTLVQQCEGGD